mgnify:FL=1
MKFILRIGINIGACYLLMIFCAYLIGELIDELSNYPTFSLLLYPILNTALLYAVNLLFNKIMFLRVSKNKSLWSVTLGILILGLYFLYGTLFPDYSECNGIVAKVALDGANGLLVMNCSIMFILSIILNLTLKDVRQDH